MKVYELIEVLSKQNPNDIVILAKDTEGNNYSPCDDFSMDIYRPETSWNGQIYIRELTPYLKEKGYTEEDLCPEGQGLDCITLWPVN